MVGDDGLKTIDDVINAIEAQGIILEDKDHFRDFFFEYACVSAEYDGINPEIAMGYLDYRMMSGARTFYWKVMGYGEFIPEGHGMMISAGDLCDIEGIVRKERGLPELDDNGYLE